MSVNPKATSENIGRRSKSDGGAFDDYMGVYPLEDYFGSNSINYSSKGSNRNELYIGAGDEQQKLDLKDQRPSDYPMNQVQQSASGHVMEFDDTPGGERVLIKHNTGSGVELRNDGSVVATTGPGGNKVEVIHGTHHFIIEGDGNITYKGNLNLKVVGDYNLSVLGNYNVSVAGNKQTNIAGSNRYNVTGSYGNIVTGGYSTTVVGQTTNTHLGGLSNNVKGTSSHNVDGPATFSSSGDMKVSSEAKINMSTPDANIAATNLSVFGDTGTIGGENIIMYNYNMYTGHSIEAVDTVTTHSLKSNMIDTTYGTAATWEGNLEGVAKFSASPGTYTGPTRVTARDTSITATALPTAAILSDYLTKSANGVNRIKIDYNNHIKNQIDKSVDTGGLSVKEVTTGIARSKLRDPANRSNSKFVGYSLSNGSICEKYDAPTPEGIGRIVSGADGTAAGGSTKLGTNTGTGAFIPNRITDISVIPEPKYNPYQVENITSSTVLAPGISMAKFLGSSEDPSTLNHIKSQEQRIEVAKYYYLHARIMKTVLDDTDQFKNFTLIVSEGMYRPGPQETITPDSINDLKSKGRAVVYSLIDQTGNHNLTALFDLAAYWKDTIAFDRLILSYDTIDCKLNGRIIVVLPEIDDTWTGTYNRKVETEINNTKLSQGELVEVLPQPSSSYNAGYAPSGSVGAGYDGTIKGAVEKLDKRLIEVLEEAAELTGLNVRVTSGFRASGNNPSGRHAGFAADTALYDGDVRLSLSDSYHFGLIKDFTKAFIDISRSKGLVPSVGAGNNELSPAQYASYVPSSVMSRSGGPLYMGGNTFHYDIARTPGIGSNLSASAGPYWGGSGETSSVPAPQWLVNLF